VRVVSWIDEVMRRLGEVYKNAHDVFMMTNDPQALEIMNLCNEMARKYEALRRELSERGGVRS